MSDVTTALEILDLALVPGITPPVYAVGMVASRITMADQQRRAINVVWALLREGRLKRGDSIAIIGAGIAGVTAAAYAQRMGLRVAVFEKYDDPFALQQGSARWVHPSIYEWPTDGWDRDATHLPCMNWRAGSARDVVATLRTEWTKVCDDIDWHPRTEVTKLKSHGVAVTLIDVAGHYHGPFDAVVMTAGFGEEPERPEFAGKPYWRDDDLHQRLRAGGLAFVSGCGDGGLIDAIRVALRDFRHDWLASVAKLAAADSTLIAELLRIERDTPRFPDGETLTKATLALDVPGAVTTTITGQLRPNTTVILNSGQNGPLTRAACLINRFVVAQLMKLDIVTFRQGKVTPQDIQRTGSKFNVPVDKDVLQVDVVVVRHGPLVRPLERFPAIDSALDPARLFLRTYRAGVDRTRAVAWGPLPSALTPGAFELSAASADVMAFLAQKIQDAIKDELARRSVQGAIVRCKGLTGSIDVSVRIASREEQMTIVVSGMKVTFAHPTRSRELSVTLSTDVMIDSGAAAPSLTARVPEVLQWILEEHA